MKGKPAKGFTLLEVLVSLAVIAIVLVSIIRLQGQTIAMNESVRFYSVAPLLARSKMTEVRLAPRSFIGGDSGEFGEEFTGYAWETGVTEKELQVENGPVIPLLEARVLVLGQDGALRYTLVRSFAGDAQEQQR